MTTYETCMVWIAGANALLLFATVVVALFGDRLRGWYWQPDLRLKGDPDKPLIVPSVTGEPVVMHHLELINVGRDPARRCLVTLIGLSEPTEDGIGRELPCIQATFRWTAGFPGALDATIATEAKVNFARGVAEDLSHPEPALVLDVTNRLFNESECVTPGHALDELIEVTADNCRRRRWMIRIDWRDRERRYCIGRPQLLA